MEFSGHFGPAIALIGLSYAPAGDVTLAVALLTVVVGLNVGHITGLMVCITFYHKEYYQHQPIPAGSSNFPSRTGLRSNSMREP